MTTLNEIRNFFIPKKIAIAGASRNEKKFGGYVIKEFLKKDFELYPINPHTDEIQGIKCFKSVSDLPEDVTHLYIVTNKSETLNIINEGIKKGIKMIWIQQGAESNEAVEAAKNAGIPVIYKKCIMMFAQPVNSIHGFHGFVSKVFGRYPKMVHQHG